MIVDRKTDVDAGSVTVTSSRILNDTEYAKETNILHRYRSFNYLFTLAAAPEEALTDPSSVRDSSNFIVIAKSGGKGQPLPVELGTSMSYEVQDTVEGYNNRSSGRFDMFIDNVEIETVMGFSQGTNLSMATKMNFEVFEPYSMNGFLESLQVSALAAGHKSYMGAPYMFKIEYIGYLTNDKVHRLGKEGTRTFIININKVEIEVNENGTKYRCQAVTYNDLAYGDNMALKTSFQMLGTTVGEVLTSLMQNLNEAASESNQEDNKDNNQYDEYEIIFPTREGNKFDYDKPNKISEAKIIELREDTKVYSFPDHSILKENADQQNTAENNKSRGVEMRYNPGSYDPKTSVVRNRYAYEDNKTVVQFPAKAKIHDIIASVIRDSEYGRHILQELQNSGNPPEMVEYAHVAVETVPLNKFNERENRAAYKYRFVIYPYQMHYTRIPLYQSSKINKGNIEDVFVRRRYSYLFTGKNLDIRTFNLKFDRLYYQAYPQGLQKIFLQDPAVVFKGSVEERPKDLSLDPFASPIRVDPNQSDVVPTGGTGRVRSYDAYDKMVKAMHDAVLDNTDMVTLDLEILGDPYYLVTSGSGNFRNELTNDRGITANGEAAYFAEDVIISIEFRNPEDIDSTTGFMKFSENKVPFGGCFRVNSVMSKFSDGMFTQQLKLVRLPGQPIDVVQQTAETQTSPEKVVGIEWYGAPI